MKVFKKTDEDVLDYDIVLSSWMSESDTVDSAFVTVPDGIENTGRQIFEDRVKIWISGGTAGQTYPFKVLCVTEGGRTKEVNFIIAVVEQ